MRLKEELTHPHTQKRKKTLQLHANFGLFSRIVASNSSSRCEWIVCLMTSVKLKVPPDTKQNLLIRVNRMAKEVESCHLSLSPNLSLKKFRQIIHFYFLLQFAFKKDAFTLH